ncbi:DUF3703 domain-containing protein [Ideonella paludis]|uniref:DUF3703 domain-containing protein n=1 Tax=Ideonella paludis TaxID=1233411 RepID=A0ABS5E3B2_9BURK|nr:DUF3703 domain-containing protein [Ideonella paludis]MBQ0937900.1 DUF3703 domain-containing protein [Ideonella paludis]
MTPSSQRAIAFDAAIGEARNQLASRKPLAAMSLLQRAHVLGQRDFCSHLSVHLLMLRAAWALRDGRELRGQLLRLVLTPIGHMSGRLPIGNIGTSDVSAFEPMALSHDLATLLDDRKP